MRFPSFCDSESRFPLSLDRSSRRHKWSSWGRAHVAPRAPGPHLGGRARLGRVGLGASTTPGASDNSPSWGLSDLGAMPALQWGRQLVAQGGCPQCPWGGGLPYAGHEGAGRGQTGLQSDGGCRGSGAEARRLKASGKRKNPPHPHMSGALVSRTFRKSLMPQLRDNDSESGTCWGSRCPWGGPHRRDAPGGTEDAGAGFMGKLVGDGAGMGTYGSSAPVPGTGAQSAGLPGAGRRRLLSQSRAQGIVRGWAVEGQPGPPMGWLEASSRKPGAASRSLSGQMRRECRQSRRQRPHVHLPRCA